MLALAALAAAQGTGGLSAPDPDALLDQDDYPQFALVRDLSAAAMVDLYVSPQGRVMECHQGREAGDGELAGALCDILLHKHVPPARLGDGTPAYSVVRGLARLFLPGTPGAGVVMQMPPPTDVEMRATRLPGGVDLAEVKVVMAIGTDGKAHDCAAGAGEKQAALVQAVCGAMAGLKADQRVGIDGMGVPYVMPLRVGLTAGDEAGPPPPEAPSNGKMSGGL